MENNWDQKIREKLYGGELQPSASAWERLSLRLDDAEKKRKRGWFFALGVAATILLIISLVFVFHESEDKKFQDFMVQEEVKTLERETIIDTHILSKQNQRRVANEDLKADAKTLDSVEKKQEDLDEGKVTPRIKSLEQPLVIATQTEVKGVKLEASVQSIDASNQDDKVAAPLVDTNSGNLLIRESIYVDSEALLLSVGSSLRRELIPFQKSDTVDSVEVLATHANQGQRSHVKVDPKIILTEIERNINQENFQNHFYSFIKKSVSEVATAIANRKN